MKRIPIQVTDEELHRRLKVQAAKEGRSILALVEDALRLYLHRPKADGEPPASKPRQKKVKSIYPPGSKVTRWPPPLIAAEPACRQRNCGHPERMHHSGRCFGACACIRFLPPLPGQ